MQKKMKLWMMCLLFLFVVACAAPEPSNHTSGSTQAAPPETTQAEASPSKPDDVETDALPETAESVSGEEATQAAPELTATVRTLDSGVQVQAVPDDDHYMNLYYLNAEKRGCESCHDLSATLKGLPVVHVQLRSSNPEQPIGISTCVTCHDGQVDFARPGITLRDALHGRHLNSELFTGNCESCHYIGNPDDADGNVFLLWDEVKYDILRGITAVPNVQGEFRYDQNVIKLGSGDDFNTERTYYRSKVSEYGIEITPDQDAAGPYNEDIYEQWTIRICGNVGTEYEMSLADMIEQFGVETQILKNVCTINGWGDNMAYQAEVTGIPLERILEHASLLEGSNQITIQTAQGDYWDTPLPLDYALEHHGMLVLQINGEPLPLSQGYPVQYWQGGISAGSFVRHLKTIVVTAEENPITVAQVSCGTPDPSTGVFFNKPNVGFQTYAEGQIFPMEQPITFEGWTDAFDQTITAMEFSMDMGATWTRYDIENADVDRWVYWYFTYTPEETGSYCLRVRAYTQEGLVTDKNIDLLFHVK